MASNRASIEWNIGNQTLTREVILREGKLLLSEYFLQSLLPPSMKLVSLKAIIQIGQEQIEVDTTKQWDIDENLHYLLDNSLSSRYVLEICNVELYISDSDEEVKFTCVDKEGGFKEKNFIDLEDVSVPISTINKETTTTAQHSQGIETKSCSLLFLIQENPRSSSRLMKMFQSAELIEQVTELPRNYNGNIIFELPPTYSKLKRMDGMEQKYDGHMWTRPHQTNMAIDCTVRLSYCLGKMECPRVTCPFYVSNKQFNQSFFHGHLDKQVSMGLLCEDDRSCISCHYCKKIAYCRQTCKCTIYYILPHEPSLTRLVVHIGNHMHEVELGTSRAAIERIKKMVSSVLQVDRKCGPRRVQMVVARQVLVEAIVGKEASAMGDKELHDILEEMVPLVQNQQLKRIVINEQRSQATIVGDGFDNILQLKKKCMFPFFHGSRFPGQGGPNDKCFLFKMSTKGPGSGVDLVNRMRRTKERDLSAAWVHFDYTHRIDGWATMSCSLYDPGLKTLMVIAICETKEEDTDSQILFWRCLNQVMEQQGHPPADFAGFIADEAGANWAAIRTIFNGGPDNVMEGRERSCLFHWEQSLQKHTKKLVKKEVSHIHIQMCESWRKSTTMEMEKQQAHRIRQWWKNGNVHQDNIKPLETWFNWWERRISHWGNLNPNTTLGPWDRAQIPNTNLSESIHASWLAGEGGNKRISLYDACVSDVVNAYLQCTKQHGYLTGRYIGVGPSMDTLLQRLASKNSPSPTVVGRAVQGAVTNTPMYEEPVIHGDKETVQRKRARYNAANASHQPGFIMESKQRKQRGRPRKIDFENNSERKEDGIEAQPMPGEVEVSKSQWAIRRMPTHCTRACLGVVKGRRCKNVMQSRTPAVVAPSFWGERMFMGGSQYQWMWFCNHDVTHTYKVAKQVKDPPEVPDVWKLDIGTTLTIEEFSSLLGAGFKFQVSDRETPSNAASGGMHGVASSSTRKKKWRSGISKEAHKKIELATQMQARVVEEHVIEIGSHVLFKVMTENCYEVHIQHEPKCSCPDFNQREVKKKTYLACKHLYFVYIRVLGLNPNQHMMIHQSTLCEGDLSFVLSQPRKMSPE